MSRKFSDVTSGSAQPQITREGLKAVEIIYPPLTEQKQIAKKLDKLLARVERIKTVLDNAPAKIKRFRQSVLASAVGGEFSDKEIEWKKLILSDVAKVATGKTPLKLEKSFYQNGKSTKFKFIKS